MADESTILKTLTHLRSTGGLAYVHAESNSLVESSQLDAVERNQISAGFHGETRSELAEVAAVRTVLDLAEAAGAPVYFVHQSTPAAIEAVREARNRGLRVFSETVVHHLVLDDAVYEGDCPELYVCCPPIRSKNSMLRVGELLGSGHVDTVGSDHCCYDTQQKASSKSDVRTMPNGLPSVETRLPVLFSQFVTTGRMTAMKFVELSSANPARLNGLFPRKGLIAPGSDADIVLWDPSAKVTLRSSDLHMATDFTPYEGISVTGRPIAAFVRGRSVVRKGEFIDSAPQGRHVKASPVFLPKEAS
ncbi:amidohydrolase family protein [Cryobacterium sp. Y50]|uniref:amidohydrolase family protein n=1 Tax=Cryobacterium sp. Y50 TaxID=2048286 RepID=UPI000CE425C2|nr:amidohydrolase family protein [Cryobacterium sp. Y50]